MPTKKVLYIVEDTEVSQFRYRVKNVIEALKSSDKWKADFKKTSEINDKLLDDINILVILRQTAKNNKLIDFIKLAQRKGIKVLFDLDDLIFDYKNLPVLMRSTNSKNVFYWMGYVWGIRRIAKKVDGFIVTNNYLGKKIKKCFNKHCVIIPNSLSHEQVSESEKLIKSKKTGNNFVIGYFSGSPTHAKDFKLIESELIEFLDKHSDARLRIVGYMDLSKKMEEFSIGGKVEILPLVNYSKLLKLISEVDVNIAPLLINDFTNCKSELKFFEAAVVETITIASPNYSFEKAISDSENGFLAKPGEWLDKLELVYENGVENKEVVKNARKYVLKHYYGRMFLKQVEGSYECFE